MDLRGGGVLARANRSLGCVTSPCGYKQTSSPPKSTSALPPKADIGGEEFPMAAFYVWLPLRSGRRRRSRSTSPFDAVDGSTAGIAMCHGGFLITANRGAIRDGSYHDRS